MPAMNRWGYFRVSRWDAARFSGRRLRAHAFLEGSTGGGPLQVIADKGDAVGAGEIEVFVRAFGFDDERRGRPSHEPAITLRIADLEEQVGLALHVELGRA